MKLNILRKITVCVVLVLLALVSFFIVSEPMSDPERYENTIAAIDSNVDTVLKLTAASTVASAGVSAIPGDTATPIAEKLADFTEYFMLVLCVLYAEKYLLTIIGVGVFKVLIPLALVILCVGQFYDRQRMSIVARKFIVFGLVAIITIPTSLYISGLINETYQTSVDSTLTATQELTEKTNELSDAEDAGVLAGLMNRFAETTSTLSDKAARILNSFIESLAVLIVTSCVIPIIMLLFFIWLIRMLTGLDIHMPSIPLRRRMKAAKLAKPKTL